MGFFTKLAYIRAVGSEFNILGLGYTTGSRECLRKRELELRESFSNSCAVDDPAVYFWTRASEELFDAYRFIDADCFSYIESARQDDPKSGFFIHEGVVYLSTESEALAARIAADEQRELTALIESNGVKSKGGRL